METPQPNSNRRRAALAVWACVIMVQISLASLAAPGTELPLWPGAAPGEDQDEVTESDLAKRVNTESRIEVVTRPTITLSPAPEAKRNGTAVIVCPGGGYNILAWTKEGTEVAQWLNSIGVTAVILKYRVPRRFKEMPHIPPLQDAQRAIRLVRSHAREWDIDPGRIGLMGFSAGGHLTVMAGTHWKASTYARVDGADALSCRPDFLIPVYPAYLHDKSNPARLSPLVQVTPETPPAWIVVAGDDKDRDIYAALFYVALKRAGVPAELHIYSRGGHGFGLRPSANPVSTWPERCADWLRVSGLLTRK